MTHTQTAPLIIVTGLAGAGMSSALKHLQDMGYETFDNFPLTLVESLIADDTTLPPHALAIGIDARSRGFSPEAVISLCQRLSGKLLFLTADEAELHKRFTETRRRHPLAKDRPVSAGIKAEQDLMMSLRTAADHVIDTTNMSVHVQHQIIEGLFGQGLKGHLTVSLMSFGFRFGLPREADIVLDVRFLKNPFWQPELKALSGLDQAIGDYVSGDPDFKSFLDHTQDLLGPLLPRYAAEGKSYLTVAIGCTGGRHRSVYTVERLKLWLDTCGFMTNPVHRDINR